MRTSRSARRATVVGSIAGALALAACGGDEPGSASEPAPSSTPSQAAEPAPAEAEAEPQPDAGEPAPGHQGGPVESAESDPRLTGPERAALRTVREYIAALDARDGERVCSLLAPGALDEIELPRRRGDCAASLEASIGYRDPRGLPVWKTARVRDVSIAELDADAAKVVATVVTEFADRDELSVEDDVIYLTRAGDAWGVAKPSSTLYRAVGIADIPPTVISPP